ncbi:thiamine phosphate synthase [Campylobacter fetus]|uniref:Thiamine phosphate synthase n=4 Tax=Campylobacter fetus TaxID=196 RepID=A0A5L4LEM8_CAMFE|nr:MULTISPECIES: thiamine phosphate synthase [Campylobacter]OCS23425.1 thiamine monophosphate synthase [Campylobacter fetus subsp. venerealis cfvi97/532]OCS26286.1 thiamine monophosphate synthase [Campylobacter fetus subsp. venerealis cfvB10]OCS30791.1 thiamine monophosphate synthase [Campylobacter fetus subsp. venerealis LMG 6570 = CCUG 33900]OCS41280.1 thiamine monophosphate synthase [Campylobacter fetus subsp. venerealis cfvi02/298]ABK82414.1 thiamine monophosphate synthase [Campylobacter f
MLSYAITDPKLYSNLKDSFFKFERLQTADFILFRDKICSDYVKKAEIFMSLKPNFKAKFIIHNDLNLALNLKADGIHFSSNLIANLKNTPQSLIKFASTHNEKEIEDAIKLGADFITFSPIFSTPNKGEPVGIETLKKIVLNSSVKVFGLGGITTKKHIKMVELAKAAGFASIRYFAN